MWHFVCQRLLYRNYNARFDVTTGVGEKNDMRSNLFILWSFNPPCDNVSDCKLLYSFKLNPNKSMQIFKTEQKDTLWNWKGTSFLYLFYLVENTTTLNEKMCTISFWLKPLFSINECVKKQKTNTKIDQILKRQAEIIKFILFYLFFGCFLFRILR